MADTNVRINVGYNVDKSGLSSLKSSLQSIQKMTSEAFLANNPGKQFENVSKELLRVKSVAATVEDALTKAFNPKLNTVNIQTFNSVLNKTNTSIEEIYSAFQKAGSTGQIAFQKLVSTTLSANKEIQKTKTLLDKMSETLGNTIKWNVASAAINAISGKAQEAYGYIKNLDTSLNNIRIVTEKSAEDMDVFAEKANKAAKALGATTTDYTNAALTFYQQGLNDQEVQARANLTLKVANASGLSADDSAEYVTAVLNGYKVGSEEAEKAMDILARVGADTASSLDELSEAMSKTASTANAMGMTEEQLASSLATVIQVTRQDASSVGTAFKTILMRISDIEAGTEDAEVSLGNYTGEMAKMGVNVLDSTGKLRDMGSVVEEVGDKWSDMSREQQIALARTMAGTRQANNLLALFDNWDTYKETLQGAENATGTLQKQQDIYMESTRAHLDELTASAENLFDSFLDADSINTLADGLGDILDLLASVTDAMGGGKGVLLALGSTAMNVFNKQIGASLGTLVSRLMTVQSVTKNIKDQLATSKEFQGLGDEVVSDIASKRALRLQYGDIMPEDVRETYDEALKKYEAATAAITKLKNSQAEAITQLQKIGEITGIDATGIEKLFSPKDSDEWADATNQAELLISKYQEMTTIDFSPVTSVLEDIKEKEKEIAELKSKLDADNPTIFDDRIRENIEKAEQELVKLQETLKQTFRSGTVEGDIDSLENQIKSLIVLFPEGSQEAKQLTAIFNELDAIMDDTAGVDKQEEAFQKLQAVIGSTIPKIAEFISKLSEIATNDSFTKVQKHTATRDATETFLGQNNKALNLAKTTAQVSQLAGAVGQLVSVMQTLSNIYNIVNDESISGGQKALQIMSGITMAIPLVISGIAGLKTALVSLTGAAESTFAAIAATPAGPALLALTALAAAIPVVVTVFDALTMSAKEAEQQISSLNDSMQDFGNTSSTYRSNKEELEGLEETYNKLAARAGAYDKNIQNLTESERKQYNEIKDKLVSLNGDLLAYYNDQGEAILKNQDGIKDTIDLLEQQYKMQQQNLYTDNQKENLQAYDKQYQDAKKNLENTKAKYDINSSTGQDRINSYRQGAQTAVGQIQSNISALNDVSPELQEAIAKISTAVHKSGQDLVNAVQTDDFNKALNIIKTEISGSDAIKDTLTSYINSIASFTEEGQAEIEAAQAAYDAASKINVDYIQGILTYDPSNNAAYNQLKDAGFDSTDSMLNNYLQGIRLGVNGIESEDDVIKAAQDAMNEIYNLLYQDGNATTLNTDLQKAGEEWDSSSAVADTYNDYVTSLQDQLQSLLDKYPELKELAQTNHDAFLAIIKSAFPTIEEVQVNEDGSLDVTNQYSDKISAIRDRLAEYAAKAKRNGIEENPTTATDEDIFENISTDNLENLDEILERLNPNIADFKENLEQAQATVEAVNNMATAENAAQLAAKTAEALNSGVNVTFDDYANKLTELAGNYDSASEELERFNSALGTGNDVLINNATSALELATQAGYLAEQTGLAAEDIEHYAKELKESGDYTDVASSELAEMAKDQLRYDKAVNSSIDNLEDWTNDLEVAAETGYLVSDTASELAEAYGDLLDINGDSLSESFLKSAENLQLMQDALNGSEEAYEQLQQAAVQDILIGIGLDQEQIDGVFANFNSLLDQYSIDLDNIEVGASLDDKDFLAGLSTMLTDIGASVDEAQSILSGLGIDAEVKSAEQEQTSESTYAGVQAVVSHNTGKAIYPMSGFLGSPEQSYDIPSIDYVPKEVTVQNTVSQVGTGVEVTSAKKSTGGNVKFTNSTPKHGGSNASTPKKSSGSGKKGNSGGSGKTSQPKTKDLNTDTIDRYHDINIQISNLSKSYDRLQKAQDKLTGKDLINNLNKQLEILEKQRDAYKAKIELAKQEANEIKNSLVQYGATFDANGEISNYAVLLTKAQQNLNSVIGWYNSLSADAQDDAADKKVTAAQKEYDKIKEMVTNYDKLINETIPGLEDDITEALSSAIELQVQKFDMEVELRLDMGEAMRDWNEFKRKVIDDLDDDDLLGKALQNQADILSYYNTANSGVGSIQSLTSKIGNAATPGSILGELQKMQNGGHSSIYSAYDAATGTWVDDMSSAVDDLKESYKELMTELENLEDLEQNVTDAFLDSIDAINDALDKNKEAYEFLGDQIDHDINLIQKLYGDDAYDLMGTYYEKQLTNIQAELAARQNAATYWKQLMDAERAAIEQGNGNKDALEKYEENWKSAVSDVNDLVESWAEALTTKYENTIDALVKSLNDKVSNGKGLDYLEEQLNLLNDNADNYLDTINAAYAKQQLQNKWQDAINDTDSVTTQQKLNELMQAQMKMLEEKGELTQYDIDRAEKEYEIALKQIALQEAQQNKSKMRLKRDANGNYSYQFVSDEDSIRQAQQDLADAQNSLYNFDKDAYKNNLNDMYSIWNEFQEKIAQAYKDYADDQDALQEHIALLQEQYGEKINYLTEQNLNIRTNLTESAFNDLANLYNVDVSNFQNMTDEEKDLIMNNLVPEWTSGVQEMIDKFSGEGGFEQTCQETFDKLKDAAQDYVQNIENISQTNQRVSDEAYDEGQKLLQESNQLIDSAKQEYQAIGDVVNQVKELISAYREAKSEAIGATKAAYDFIQAKNAKDAAQAAEEQKRAEEAAKAAAAANSSNSSVSSSSSSSSGAGSSKDGTASVGDVVGYNGKYYYDSYGKAPAGSKYSGVTDGVVIDKMNSNTYGVHIHSADGKYGDLGWVKKSQLFGYDTGGYTGTWGEDGRLALLHQKELVLNKDDTANMLSAMNVLRGIVSKIGDNVFNNTAAVLSTIGSTIAAPKDSSTLEQTVYITAKFEGQTEASQIETALKNLVNTASQRAYRNNK